MRRKRFRNSCIVEVELEPLVRLWLLRMLVPLQGQRKFILDHGYDNDEIATLFALPGTALEAEYDPGLARKRLQQCHREAEQSSEAWDLPQPLRENLQKLMQLVGLNDIECQLLGFAVMLNQNRLLNDVSDWLGTELSMLHLSYTLAVLLDVPQQAVQEALSSRGLLAQSGLLTVDRDYKNVLSSKLDILSNSFAYRLMSESSSPVNWLRDMVVPSQAPHLTLADYPHLQDQLDFLLPYLQQAVNSTLSDSFQRHLGASGVRFLSLSPQIMALADNVRQFIGRELASR